MRLILKVILENSLYGRFNYSVFTDFRWSSISLRAIVNSVAENAKLEICGLLLATLDQHIFSHLLVASVMYYIVRPEDRLGGYGVRLLKAFEKWSSNRQVAEINLGINSEVQMEIVGRFVKKMGYSKVGENFVLSMRPLDDSVTLVNEL